MTNALPHTALQHSGEYTFMATREYFDQLVNDIEATKSGDRVLLAAMTLDPSVPTIARVTDAMGNAAMRGVQTTLEIDAHSFMVDDNKRPGPLFYHTVLPSRLTGFHAELNTTLQQMRDNGVEVAVTNPPHRRFMSPFSGRSHIKASIINDIVYLGGCNLSTLHLDEMVRWHDPQTADWLYDLLQERVRDPSSLSVFGSQDIRHTVDDTTDIILDVGIKRQSAIYEQALKVIDQAEDWLVLSCQFFPNSSTAKHLQAAHRRGVRVIPIFNHYSAHSPLHTYLQHAVTARERLRMPRSFFDTELQKGQTFLHAKVLASERESMVGSHNYIPSGVNFGTAEIAMHSRNPQFSRASAQLILEESGLSPTIHL